MKTRAMKAGLVRRAACGLLLLLALSPASAFGQGCAMCLTSANAANDNGKRALNRAVTMLLVPTLGLMAGFVGLVVKYGRKDEEEQAAE